MKAIIPVAGAGRRLRPHSYTQPKALIPLANKTVLSIIIDQLAEAGIKEFVLIIGYMGDKIADFIKKNHSDITAHFIIQEDRRGIGHAVNLTKEIIGDDEALITLGDTICEYNIADVLDNPHSAIGVKKIDNPGNFGVAYINNDKSIDSVIEKPQIPMSNMAMVGIYKIKETNILFECLEKNIAENVLTYGELTITDAIECMIKKGVRFDAFKVDNWYDAGNKETLLHANMILLKKFNITADPSKYQGSVIIPPVSIGEGCVITSSVIGPNVTLGENTIIERSVVSNSIIGEYANLSDIVLMNSLIGNDTLIKGKKRILNIGDHTTIDLG